MPCTKRFGDFGVGGCKLLLYGAKYQYRYFIGCCDYLVKIYWNMAEPSLKTSDWCTVAVKTAGSALGFIRKRAEKITNIKIM